MATGTTYPECKKLEKHEEFIRNVLEFIEFAQSDGVALTKSVTYSEEREEMFSEKKYTHKQDFHDVVSAEKLLYKMFGIDTVALEKERRSMLASLSA